MIRFALKGLLGRKLRTALTALAIVLGVAMISGTYVLTDSIDSAFDTIFTEVRQGSSAVVTGKAAFDLSDGSGATAPAFPESVLETVRGVDGVALAEGSVDSDSTTLIGRDGKAVVNGGAPNLGFAIAQGDSPFNPLALVEGDWPGPNEVVIDSGTAKDEDFKIGDVVGVQAEGPSRGSRSRASSGSTPRSRSAARRSPASTYRPRSGSSRRWASWTRSPSPRRPAPSDTQLVENIEDVLPPGTQVRSGQAQAADDASDTNEFITFLQGFLLAFAGIALFVGSFVIANSLSITIAQRAREFATVRTLGGSRRQILSSIVVEALVVGTAASVVGLFLGLGLAKRLFWLFDLVGFTLPNSGLLFETRTIVVSLAVGIIVTLLASLRPAIRATRVPPIAAVREGATLPESRFARFRTPARSCTGLGFAALALRALRQRARDDADPDLDGPRRAADLPRRRALRRPARPAARDSARLAGRRLGGSAGRLARDNARRNPQRTASTAAALMIGLALVTLVATLAAGITSTFRGAVDDIFTSDYAITAQNNFSPIPIDAAEAAAKTPGVEAIASTRTGEARVFGSTEFVTAVDPDAGEVITLDWVEGSQDVFRELGADGAFVDDGYAKDHGLSVGSPITVTVPSGKELELTVKGIFDPPAGGSPFGVVTFSSATFDKVYDSPRNLYTFILMNGGETEQNTQALEASLGTEFPNAKVQTRDEFVDNQIAALNQILNILYVLLALSVIVSLFGIVNTLVLTVFERTRELGMLRAIGMTRRQVRRMIRHESVITALIGGTLGIILGVILGALLISRVDFIEFALPTTQIIVFAILTIVVGIVAAIFPARRAARLNPLEALQYE